MICLLCAYDAHSLTDNLIGPSEVSISVCSPCFLCFCKLFDSTTEKYNQIIILIINTHGYLKESRERATYKIKSQNWKFL